jgi:acetoin utilization protein AcuB
MFVRDRMSAPAIVLSPEATASSALAFMQKRKIRRTPVVRDGKLVGIVTMSDLLGVANKKFTTGSVTTVAQVMTGKPFTVQSDETLEVAAQLMMSRKVSGLPVLDGDRVVGILTESDLFRALCQMLGFGERGARVVMQVDDDEDLIDQIRGRLKRMLVRSLVTVHDPKRGVWDVVMRVRGRTEAAPADERKAPC